MADTKEEINRVINELDKRGVDINDHVFAQDKAQKHLTEEGLGDVVESVLKKFGITEERFKKWFNLKECNCSKRKKWLNGLFSRRKNYHDGKQK